MDLRCRLLVGLGSVYAALVLAGFAEAAETLVPPVAPELTIEETIGVPDGAELSWAALSGNVVVLEFWSTQCAPCVGAIPHLNRLVQEFADKPVRFLSITKEDEKTVNRFLRKRPIRGWIGLDLDGSTAAAFGATEIPHTVIVDAKGRVVAVTSPLDVTEQVIQDVLAGKLPNLPPPDTGEQVPIDSGGSGTDEEPPLFELVIRTSTQTNQSVSGGDTEFQATGWRLRSVVAFIHGVPPSRVEVPDVVSERRYDVLIRWRQDGGADSRALLAQILRPALAVSTRTESRTVEVYVLGAPKEAANLRIEKNTVSGMTNYSSTIDGVMRRTNIGMDALARDLETLLTVPVINETGLSGGYDWELEVDEGKPETIPLAVQEKLGLPLTNQRREVTFVVVEPVNAER